MKLKFILCGLILTVCGNLYAADENTSTQSSENTTTVEASASQSSTSEGAAPVATGTPGRSGSSFMAAFGMGGSPVGDSGEAGPSARGMEARAGGLSTALNAGATNANNQVAPPFTPYSYRK